MQVILAQPRGFCAGVVRAVDIVERALAKFGAPVYVRHEIVHNRHVVEGLKAKGGKETGWYKYGDRRPKRKHIYRIRISRTLSKKQKADQKDAYYNAIVRTEKILNTSQRLENVLCHSVSCKNMILRYEP